MSLENECRQLVRENVGRGTFRVGRRLYHDEAIYRRELATIFKTCWLYVGHVSEIPNPGDFLTRRIANRPILFVRDAAGTVRALLNTCSHRGAIVCRQVRGTAKSFQCQYHGWVFRADGKLVFQPGSERYSKCINTNGALDLPSTPRLESYRDFYFINFDRDAIDLASYLGNAKEYIDLVIDQSAAGMRIVPGTQEYHVEANWKLLAENSVDMYHGLPLHPTYIAYLTGTTGALAPLEAAGGVSRDLGNGHSVTEYRGPWGRPVAQWIPMWGENARREIEGIRKRLVERHGEERAERIACKSRNLLVFPNFVINDIVAVTVRVFQPTAPGTMLVNSWALAPGEESEDVLARRLDNYLEFLGPAGFATPDDVGAMEACQRGFSDVDGAQWTDFSKGMGYEQFDYEDEAQMRAFWRKWHELMGRPAGNGSVSR